MASTEGLVPITRAFLSSYYDTYQFPPLSDDIPRLSSDIHSLTSDFLSHSPPTPGEERLVVDESERRPPHKVDENMWKNREHMEEIIFLLDRAHWPQALQEPSSPEDAQLATVLTRLHRMFNTALKALESFQAKNSERVFSTVMTYIPQDFRGRLIRLQRERSERNKQAEIDAMISSGASIRDRYAVLWKQQMERRRLLAQLGSATGVYKTLVKYLVGVPQVLLDFVRQINDDDGPMEEQRQRYGPPLYSLTTMVLLIRLAILLSWGRNKQEVALLEQAVDVYTTEFERFIKFIRFLRIRPSLFQQRLPVHQMEGKILNNDDYKEISVAAGKTHEVSLTVDSINSYIAWDFSLVQGKINLDIGFSVEYTNASGEKSGNFCTCEAGKYKLIWDNSYSSFFKKVLRFKVDCIPPVVETVPLATEAEE
ncbi:hypothetical protein ACLB2K_060725 [Fragaria x ananassa]